MAKCIAILLICDYCNFQLTKVCVFPGEKAIAMQLDLVVMSKFLSYILRHHPAAITISQVTTIINAAIAMKAKNTEMYRYLFNWHLV